MKQTGMSPDPWQARLLRCLSDRTLLLCCRQAGKSTIAATLALRTALLEAPALILVLSPTQRQSGELFRAKLLPLLRRMNPAVPVLRETALTLELANGSRVVALPESEGGIRGFSSVDMIIIDEASRVSDGLYNAVRPMLAVSKGRLLCLSTPFGRRGWFFDEWQGSKPWDRVRISADKCPRITAEFLAEEKATMGERWFNQEYMCSFEDSIDAVFSDDDIRAAISADVVPLAL